MGIGNADAATTSTRLTGDALQRGESDARAAMAAVAEGTPQVEAAQAFEVSDGASRLRVVPVRYRPRSPGPLANVDACALVITPADGPSAVVQTIGVGYSESVGCTGLEGIAFPDLDGDGRFEIALIYSSIAPPDRYGTTPVVVRRTAEGTFAVDEALGTALDERGGIRTLAALRSAAAGLSRTPRPAARK